MAADRLLIIVLAALVVLPGPLGVVSAASWQPGPGDWTHYRGSATRTGTTSADAAFTANVVDLRVKWQRADDPGYWVVPVAADLDGDGVAEIVGTVGNATADPNNLNNPVSLESGVNVINGATGALKWRVGPTTGNLAFFSPTLGDIDGDGFGDVVFQDGNPLTGNFATNKIHAYSHTGQKKWEWSDANWGSKTPLAINGLAIGDVDGETARQEVVGLIMLANLQTVVSGGVVRITASSPEYRMVALNGEGSGSVSWQRTFANGTGSSPALADMDGDGTLDVIFGSGVRPGIAILRPTAEVTVNNDWADNRFRIFHGGASPSERCSHTATDYFPGEIAQTPAMADLDGDGKLELVQPLWRRTLPPGAGETAQVAAIDGDCQRRWTTDVGAAIVLPVATGDLDGDGRPDIVVQTHNGSAADRFRAIALRHDGSLLWKSADFGRPLNSTPVIADITGDGKKDIVVVVAPVHGVPTELAALDGQTGAVLWRKAVDAVTSQAGPLVVDLDGDDDGRAEIVVNIGDWRFPGKLVAYEPELPDLRLTDLAFSAAEHLHGVTETISAKVTNIGSRAANGAVVRFTEEGAPMHEEAVTLAPGASKTVSFPWTPATTGARAIRAAADPGKAIPEWSERNNEQSATATVRAPDFRFASGDPVFSDSAPGVGDTIQVSATLTNAGGKDATNVLVRFLDQGATFAEHTVASLAKGASVTIAKDLLVQGEFDHTIAVAADPDGAIVEENENDNRASRVLDVVFIAPDLTLGAITFSNPTPGADDTIQVRVPVSNVGSKDAQGIVVRFLDEGAAFADVLLGFLAEGATETVTADLLVQGEFVHTIEAVADPANAIGEEDEGNNRASAQLHVLAADLSIAAGDIKVSDPNPDDLDLLTVTATVRNVGTGGKAPANVLVHLLDEGALVATAVLPSVPAGTAADATMGYVVHGVGPHRLTVQVDPLGAVTEVREDNNEAESGVIVGKVAVKVAMGSNGYPFREQASGLATLTFRNTGQPLQGMEFRIPVEYVLRTSPSQPGAANAVGAVAAVLGQVAGEVSQRVHVCVVERCVDSTVEQAVEVARLLGGGSGTEPDAAEFRFRFFTIEARTNLQGQSGFTVPYSVVTAFDQLRGLLSVEACLTGFGDVFEAVGQGHCLRNVSPLPNTPGAANVPGRYRANAVVDWFGFGFHGQTDYFHA